MAANTTYLAPGEGETVFSVSASPIKFGVGALGELGADAQSLGMQRVALFVDPHVLASTPGETALRSLSDAGVDVAVYDGCAANRTAIRSSRQRRSPAMATSTASSRWAAAR